MIFADADFTLPAAGRQIHVRITGDALHTMWDASSGPQTAQGLIEAHIEMIAHIVGEKSIAGYVGEGGVVVVTAMDLEG